MSLEDDFKELTDKLTAIVRERFNTGEINNNDYNDQLALIESLVHNNKYPSDTWSSSGCEWDSSQVC
jgi:hypothetical protein